MTARDLHLVAYDIAKPSRLNRCLKITRRYATGGQKSVHECYLSPAEREHMKADLRTVIDARSDRVLLLRLGARTRVDTLGIAVPPNDPRFFHVV